MENSASFVVNESIRRWRESLEGSAVLRRPDLEELESHLRDSVEGLLARGLKPGEAFEVAVHRLGDRQELEAEFAKVNARHVWAGRAIWILCGLLAANMLWSISAVFSNVVLNLAIWNGMNPYVVGALNFLTHWLAWGALVAIGFLVVTRFWQHLGRMAQACIKRPIWTGIALVLVLHGVQVLSSNGMRILEPLWQAITNPGRRVPQETQTVLQTWFLWSGLATQVFWIASLPLFAGYVWRRTGQRRSPRPVCLSEQFEPAEMEAIRSLQTKGISAEEAALVIGCRRNRRGAFAREDECSPRNVWLERALWMLVGLVGEHLLMPLIMDPSTILLVSTQGSSPLVQHLAGFGAMFLCLGVLVGVLVLISKAVTTYPRAVKRVGDLCGERPVLAAILFTGTCVVIATTLFLLARTILPAQRGISQIGGRWLSYCSFVIYLIVPVVLLLKLARKRGVKAHPPA